MSTYLVTGVAGFIAARVAELLLAEGHEVVGVDNLNDYYDVRLKRHRLERLARCVAEKSGTFVFQQLDIEDRVALEAIFAGHRFDTVINLAARAGVRYSLENPFVYLSTNVAGTLNLLEGMRAHGVRKFVLASTSSLYAGQPVPFTEDLPVNTPLSPYAASKKAAEALAYSYHHLYGLDVVVLRYFTVFGPAGRPDMSIFRFIEAIDTGAPLTVFGDGTQTRDFTYVDDIARGTVAAAATPLGHAIINLGGGNAPLSLNAMITFVENELGKKAVRVSAPAHAADMAATGADISQAKRLLNWTPQVPPEEGFRRTVAWHRENAGWLRGARDA